MSRLTVLIPLLAALTGLATASSVQASSSQVVADCNQNGHLTHHYSRKALQGALNGMGADTEEYTDCYDVIHQALLASSAGAGGHTGGGASGGGQSGTGGGSGSGGSTGTAAKASGGSAVSTRGVYSASQATPGGHGSGRSIALDGSTIAPGGGGAVNTGSDVRSLPAPLIAVLVLLGIAAIGGGGFAVRRRVLARNGA